MSSISITLTNPKEYKSLGSRCYLSFLCEGEGQIAFYASEKFVFLRSCTIGYEKFHFLIFVLAEKF